MVGVIALIRAGKIDEAERILPSITVTRVE
jgi:hypothetical protein